MSKQVTGTSVVTDVVQAARYWTQTAGRKDKEAKKRYMDAVQRAGDYAHLKEVSEMLDRVRGVSRIFSITQWSDAKFLAKQEPLRIEAIARARPFQLGKELKARGLK
ncbi:MAG: hypothetical protein KGQ41_04975 [Alphaproteobacteria bacterium]|nr:hypothetical protein [Alphaproteobacteria bacterium]